MADFGARLREARERKGISLRQIAASTKISVAALEGLERNDISRLPGGIFSRAFVRSYAIEVGLDPEDTVREFLEQFSDEVPPPPGAAAPRATPAGRSTVSRSMPRLSVEAGDADSGSIEEVDFESKQRMAGVVLTLVLFSVPLAGAILYFSSRGAGSLDGQTSQAAADASALRDATPRASEPPAEPAVVPPSAAAAVDDRAQVRPSDAIAARPDPSAMRLEIAPTADCWIQLTVDGRPAVSRVVPVGDRETRDFSESAVLQVGDAAACAFSIDGQPAKPLGRARQVRQIRITRDNYRTFLP